MKKFDHFLMSGELVVEDCTALPSRLQFFQLLNAIAEIFLQIAAAQFQQLFLLLNRVQEFAVQVGAALFHRQRLAALLAYFQFRFQLFDFEMNGRGHNFLWRRIDGTEGDRRVLHRLEFGPVETGFVEGSVAQSFVVGEVVQLSGFLLFVVDAFHEIADALMQLGHFLFHAVDALLLLFDDQNKLLLLLGEVAKLLRVQVLRGAHNGRSALLFQPVL